MQTILYSDIRIVTVMYLVGGLVPLAKYRDELQCTNDCSDARRPDAACSLDLAYHATGIIITNGHTTASPASQSMRINHDIQQEAIGNIGSKIAVAKNVQDERKHRRLIDFFRVLQPGSQRSIASHELCEFVLLIIGEKGRLFYRSVVYHANETRVAAKAQRNIMSGVCVSVSGEKMLGKIH